MSFIGQKTLVGLPGSTSVVSSDLAYVIPLEVDLDNKAFDIVYTSPGNREVQYISSIGKFKFADAFPGDPANDVGKSTVYVKYKL